MYRTRPPVLAAAVLTLITACGQTEVAAPTLAPQLGTSGTQYAVGVALNKAGHLYALTEDHAAFEDEDFGHVEEENALLSRYDHSGNLLWERESGGSGCYTDYELDCGNFDALDVAVDGAGNAYSLTYAESYACDAGLHTYSAHIRKLSAAGTELWSQDVASATAFAVDVSGNVYTVGDNDTGYGEGCDGVEHVDPPYAEIVRKYTTNGRLLWGRTLNVGRPTDVAVSGSGSVYVVGTTGMSRYSSLGSLTWTKPVAAEEVTISGSNLYTRYRTALRKFDGSGKQLWLNTQSGLKTLIIQRMTGDPSGNLYLSGKYAAGTGDWNAFGRKVNASGTVLWTKTFGTFSRYDDARAVATYDGSEIYLAGETQGTLSVANASGSGGYLYKMNSGGNRVWLR